MYHFTARPLDGMLMVDQDLLIIGTGPSIRPLSPATRQLISNLGMRVEVLDTRNAASQYNLLATERGVDDVAAALIPLGWKEDDVE
jgi:NADH dehydrogenase [ubiquinone] 1 alpha subcomplex assembly factor 3